MVASNCFVYTSANFNPRILSYHFQLQENGINGKIWSIQELHQHVFTNSEQNKRGLRSLLNAYVILEWISNKLQKSKN